MLVARPRKKNLELPSGYQYRHSGYHFVEKGKWKKVAETLAGCLEHARKRAESPEGIGRMPVLIDKVLPLIKKGALRTKKKGIPLSSGTCSQYDSAAKQLRATFRHMNPDQITAADVWDLLDDLTETPVAANTCISLLRQIMSYAVRTRLIPSNPALEVGRAFVAKRTRLISWQEYKAIYAKATPHLQVIMDLLYLTGQRVMDVLTIKHADLREEGIYFEQDKTEARLVVAWTQELRGVVQRVQSTPRHIKASTLLHNRKGRVLDYDAVLGLWTKACDDACVDDAQMRDLRAMSLTRVKQEHGKKAAQAVGGHATEQMTETYLRDREVPVVQGPTFGGKK